MIKRKPPVAVPQTVFTQTLPLIRAVKKTSPIAIAITPFLSVGWNYRGLQCEAFAPCVVDAWEAGKYGERLYMSRPTYPPFQRSSDAVSSGGFAGGYESIHLSPSPIVSLAVDVLRIHASTSRCGFRLCAREVSKVLSHSSPPFFIGRYDCQGYLHFIKRVFSCQI